MALHHAASGEIIPLRPFGGQLAEAPSAALLKAHQLEVMRLVLPAGKTVPEHRVGGELTMQCLEGRIEVSIEGRPQRLLAGEMLYLEGNTPYALRAEDDSALLMTVVLVRDQESASADLLPT